MMNKIYKLLRNENLIYDETVVNEKMVKEFDKIKITPFLKYTGSFYGDEKISDELYLIEKEENGELTIKKLPYEYVNTDDDEIFDYIEIDTNFDIKKYITENTIAVVRVYDLYKTWDPGSDYRELTIFLKNKK
jgi:hypothetical protein